MALEERDYTALLIKGDTPLVEPNGSLKIEAKMYLAIVAANAEFEREVRKLIGEDFDALLRKRMRAVIPHLLEMLRNREVVYAIANHVHFIIVLGPTWGIPINEFTNKEELRRLWHDAHQRSVLNSRNIRSTDRHIWAGRVGAAVLAGVPLKELGVTQEEADTSLDEYFCRSHPLLQDEWREYQAEYTNLNTLLAT